MCKNNKCNVFAVIGIIVAAVAVVSAAAYFIYRFMNKRCLTADECYEFDCSDCTADDCVDCPLTEATDEPTDAE